MKFVLFVEGHTERKAIPAFLKRWLDPQLNQPVGIKPVRFEGWAELVDDAAKKAHQYLDDSANSDIIAVVSLLDLYGPAIYPGDALSASARESWGRVHIEGKVNREKFRHFFAVHEIEAWLLSQPEVFPTAVREGLPDKPPEQVNFDEPPGYLLDRLYGQATGKKYKKVVYGGQLFGKLDPSAAYKKCPRLQALLDEMLALAKAAGL
jgi:hypothetical protein